MLLAPAVSVCVGKNWFLVGVEKTLEILWLSVVSRHKLEYTVSAFNISCRGHNEKKVEKQF